MKEGDPGEDDDNDDAGDRGRCLRTKFIHQ